MAEVNYRAVIQRVIILVTVTIERFWIFCLDYIQWRFRDVLAGPYIDGYFWQGVDCGKGLNISD